MKKLIISVLILILVSFTSPVHANRAAVNALVGIGAITVGAVLLHDSYQPSCYHQRHGYPPRYERHWAPRKVWIPPVRMKIWSPGYYSKHGRWMRGRWRTVTRSPGYWGYRNCPNRFELRFR